MLILKQREFRVQSTRTDLVYVKARSTRALAYAIGRSKDGEVRLTLCEGGPAFDPSSPSVLGMSCGQRRQE
jgi:hypothetical protein